MSGEKADSGRQADDRARRKLDNLAHLGNTEFRVDLELGRRQMTLEEVMRLREQDVIELGKLAGEAFEVRVNDHVFAMGEVVVVTDLVACRLTSMVKA